MSRLPEDLSALTSGQPPVSNWPQRVRARSGARRWARALAGGAAAVGLLTVGGALALQTGPPRPERLSPADAATSPGPGPATPDALDDRCESTAPRPAGAPSDQRVDLRVAANCTRLRVGEELLIGYRADAVDGYTGLSGRWAVSGGRRAARARACATEPPSCDDAETGHAPRRGGGAGTPGADTGKVAADRRQALLDRVVDHWAGTRSTDVSLRALAAAVGTSHRMLLYHFGSVEGLLTAAVSEVERRQRAHLQHLAGLVEGRPASSLAGLAHALWEHLAAEQLWPLERLFFGLYARLLEQGREDQAAALVAGWLEPVEALLTAHGVPPERAGAQARLGLAVTRGLLLDLLATGDRAGADAAHRAYVSALYP